jgi:hypothetical protein
MPNLPVLSTMSHNPAFGTIVDIVGKIASQRAIWRKVWRKPKETAF